MKIDTTKISGFDGMSAEEKLNALLAMDVPDPVDLAGYVKKDVFDAKATEAANLSKQLKARMTDDEAAKAAEATARQELEDKYNALLKESTVAKYKAKYLAMGYEEKLAEDTARAMYDGDTDKVFANAEKFKAEIVKSVKADVLKATPTPAAANGIGETMTLDKIFGIKDHAERQAAIANNMNLFERNS